MNTPRLILAYLRWRPLQAVLNLLLMAVGIATLVVVLLFGHQIEQRLEQDAKGVDLVVGAQGSPIQLILSTVFHADVPTGNIPVEAAEQIGDHRLVAGTIPLALGDSYRGFRIVGTEHAYPELYGATPASGRLWEGTMEAVAGAEAAARTGLSAGATFTGTHGIMADDRRGHVHDYAPYTVVGVLEPTGTVLDRLILTSVESVWHVHDEDAIHGEEHEDEHGHGGHEPEDEHGHEARRPAGDAPGAGAGGAGAGADGDAAADPKELTALLVQYRSPLAALALPREINREPGLMAASPAFESARLMEILGFGLDTLRAFAWVLVAAAALALFIGLYTALRERRHDLAVMRVLGASRGRVFVLIVTEGVVLACLGAVLGLMLGHAAAELLGQWLATTRQVSFTGAAWLPRELWLIAAAAGVGALAALPPAVQAYRTDIARTLSER